MFFNFFIMKKIFTFITIASHAWVRSFFQTEEKRRECLFLLQTSNLKHQQNHAIWLLKQIFTHLKVEKEKAYDVFWDFSKAFDRVNRKKLLHILLPDLSAHMWLYLYKYCSILLIFIWGTMENEKTKLSYEIKIVIGVK